jgi:hypothetical protein
VIHVRKMQSLLYPEMKLKILLFFAVLFFKLCDGQNLVPNPGFEIYSSSNDTSSFIWDTNDGVSIPNMLNIRYGMFGRYALNWYSNYDFGVLRNRCLDSLGNTNMIEPIKKEHENIDDTLQLTHSGRSSANLTIVPGVDISTSLWTSLKDTLFGGCDYKISFYIYVTNASNVIFNNIGVVFNLPDSAGILDEGSEKLALYYLKNEKNLVRGEWMKLEFNYRAMGDETSINIGKYYIKKKIKPLKKKQNEYFMSIYIDDVSVERVEPQN